MRPSEYLHDLTTRETDDRCIIWPFYITKTGYGQLTVGNKTKKISRIVCEMVWGDAPTTIHQAAHECGNSACCNPKHITWKTPKENCDDRVAHGTAPVGERNGQSKLCEDDVRYIRRLLGSRSIKGLAREFAVVPDTIRSIRDGKTWVHTR